MKRVLIKNEQFALLGDYKFKLVNLISGDKLSRRLLALSYRDQTRLCSNTYTQRSHPSPFGISGEDPSACNNYQSVNKTYAFIMSECGPPALIYGQNDAETI